MATVNTWVLDTDDGIQCLKIELNNDPPGLSLHLYDGIWYDEQQMANIIATIQNGLNALQALKAGG